MAKPVKVPEATLSVVPAGTAAHARTAAAAAGFAGRGHLCGPVPEDSGPVAPAGRRLRANDLSGAHHGENFYFRNRPPGIRQERIQRNDRSIPAFVQESHDHAVARRPAGNWWRRRRPWPPGPFPGKQTSSRA